MVCCYCWVLCVCDRVVVMATRGKRAKGNPHPAQVVSVLEGDVGDVPSARDWAEYRLDMRLCHSLPGFFGFSVDLQRSLEVLPHLGYSQSAVCRYLGRNKTYMKTAREHVPLFREAVEIRKTHPPIARSTVYGDLWAKGSEAMARIIAEGKPSEQIAAYRLVNELLDKKGTLLEVTREKRGRPPTEREEGLGLPAGVGGPGIDVEKLQTSWRESGDDESRRASRGRRERKQHPQTGVIMSEPAYAALREEQPELFVEEAESESEIMREMQVNGDRPLEELPAT